MSAYIVDKKHIQYLVGAMLSRRIVQNYGFSYWNGTERIAVRAGDYEQAAHIGTILWQENVKSVNARYSDATDLEAYQITPDEVGNYWDEFDPVQVIKACHCLDYQSCEHEGWQASDAKAILTRLIKCACNALAGYDKAQWGAPETAKEKSDRVRAEMRPKIMTQLAHN